MPKRPSTAQKPSPDKSTQPASEIEYAEAFIATIMTSPRTAATYRFGLMCLARFIADTKYIPLPLRIRRQSFVMTCY